VYSGKREPGLNRLRIESPPARAISESAFVGRVDECCPAARGSIIGIDSQPMQLGFSQEFSRNVDVLSRRIEDPAV